MRKIAVYSFFESYNIGDILIAQQVKKLFNSDCAEFSFFDISSGKVDSLCQLKNEVVFDSSKTFKRKILNIPFLGDFFRNIVCLKSKNYKPICSAAKDFDTVVFAGGNQVMELYRLPTNIINFYRTIKRLKRENKYICFCFCGIGPFKSRLSEKIAKKIFSMADFISVRDAYSLGFAKKFAPEKNVEIWCDPVLFREVSTGRGNKNAIGINTYFGHDSGYRDAMQKAFAELIKELRSKLNTTDIYLFSSELTDRTDIKSIKSYFNNDDKVIEQEIYSEDELFDFYNEVDTVFAARMHTAITATVSGLPVLTVAWQKKVEAFMELMDNSDLNFTTAEFTSNPNQVAEKLIFSIENKEKIVEKNHQSLTRLRDNTSDKLGKFISTLED